MTGQPGAKSPHEAFFYYHMDQLQAVRSGPWKLYLALKNKRGQGGGKAVPARLFHLETDLGETTDLAAERPDVVQRLLGLAEKAREDLGDEGAHRREPAAGRS